jgi:AcrR family transcriptional regulator
LGEGFRLSVRERFDVSPRKAKAKVAPARRGRPATPEASKYDLRRAEIIDAAIKPLNTNGVRGTTLAEVGASLGLAPTAAGYYFRRKEDLAAACLLKSFDKVNQLIDDAQAKEGDAVASFIRRFVDYRRQVETGEDRDIAWFEDVPTLKNPEVDAAYNNMFRNLRLLFREPVTADNRTALTAKTHLLLYQFYWAVTWLQRYHIDDYADIAESIIDLFRNGLAAPGRAWSPKPLSIPPFLGGADNSREAFLRAATALINEEGYLGASVQKISARLNVTKGSFYHHHDTKDDLIARCYERTWDIMRTVQVAADVATDNALDDLASLAAYLAESQMTGETVLLRTNALAAAPSELRPVFVRGFDRTSSRFATIISRGIAEQSIRAVNVPVAAHMITAALNAAAELKMWLPHTDPASAPLLLARPLFHGIPVADQQ